MHGGREGCKKGHTEGGKGRKRERDQRELHCFLTEKTRAHFADLMRCTFAAKSSTDRHSQRCNFSPAFSHSRFSLLTLALAFSRSHTYVLRLTLGARLVLTSIRGILFLLFFPDSTSCSFSLPVPESTSVNLLFLLLSDSIASSSPTPSTLPRRLSTSQVSPACCTAKSKTKPTPAVPFVPGTPLLAFDFASHFLGLS